MPGKKNTADFLSRYPSLRSTPDPTDENISDEIKVTVIAAVDEVTHEGRLTINDEDIEKAAAEDPVYQMLIAKVQNGGWHTQRAQEVQCLRPFYSNRDRLSVVRGMVTYTYDQGPTRILIPESLRHRVSASLHAGH